MSTKTETIILKAIDIIRSNPDGIRYSELVKKLQSELPDYPVNTINGIVWNLEIRASDKIYKPVRGFYRLTMFKEKVDKNKDENVPVLREYGKMTTISLLLIGS